MIKPQLYIDTGIINQATGLTQSNWLLSDLNDKVSVTIKDAIKKSKDIAKVFTAYTNPFTLPASKRNNIIFKRFSNNKVFDGFDPRRKYDARIQLNGVDFKKGYIKLNKVNMVNNQPFSYSVQFFGELASLKDTVSDTKLKELIGLDKYTFPYTDANVQKGFETGFDVVINDGAGLRQESSITVTQVPTVTGNVTVTLNGSNHTFQVSGGAGATEVSVAANIAYEINLIEGYTSASAYNIALVVSDVNAVESPIGFSYGSAVNLLVVLATVQVGTDLPQDFSETTVIENSQGMFKFPLLPHTRGFEYTKTTGQLTNHEGFHRLLTDTEKADNYLLKGADTLNKFDLKPALKLPYIFEAIEEKFPSISFNKDWLFGTTVIQKSPLKDMYLWLHNKKGFIGGGTDKHEWSKMLRVEGAGEAEGEWDLLSGNDVRGELELENTYPPVGIAVDITLENVVGDGEADFKLDVYMEGEGEPVESITVTGEVSNGILEVSAQYFPVIRDGSYYLKTTIYSDTSLLSYKPTCSVRKIFSLGGDIGTYRSAEYDSGGALGTVIVLDSISPASNMPDYKIIDFLSDLFKLYNLVAFEEVQDDGSYKINIQSYDYYINSGIKYDITQYIDTKKSSVERISPFSTINYSFAEPKTFLAINQKEITGDDFGNASFNVNNFTEGPQSTNSLLFDGGKYDVKPKLEKMMYERISDSEDNLTPIQWGWFVNDNKENIPEPVVGKPLFMFTANRTIGTPLTIPYPINWVGDELVTNGDFATDSDWVKQAGWTISGGKAVATSASSGNTIGQDSVVPVIGKKYKITYTISNYSSGGVNSILGGVSSSSETSSGTYSEIITATSTGDLSFQVNGTSNLSIDNVSVSEIHISNSCVAPSNVTLDSSQTLHFNAEFDEYTREVNENSLFENFHSNYISSIYSSFARKIKLDAFLPPLIFSKLRLSDTIIIDNISYFIDTMDINITTSKTKFSLLRVTDIETRLQGRDENNIGYKEEDIKWEREKKLWNEGGRLTTLTPFETRVYDDGGTIESGECIDLLLGFKNYNMDYYYRVYADGGIVESLECVTM